MLIKEKKSWIHPFIPTCAKLNGFLFGPAPYTDFLEKWIIRLMDKQKRKQHSKA